MLPSPEPLASFTAVVNTRSSKRARLPWVVAFVLTPLACVLWFPTLGNLPIASHDTGYHLAVGRWITERSEVPRLDPFCFGSEGLDWINHNWLSQIAIYSVYARWGLGGLQCFRVLTLTLTLVFLSLSLRRVRAPPLISLLILGLVGAVLLGIHQVRPRLIAFLAVSCMTWILVRPDPEERLGRWSWCGLTLIALAMNNLHGGFVYCYLLLGADAIGTAVGSAWRRGPWLPTRARWLVGSAGVGLAGFVFHPHGFDAFLHAVHYVERLGPSVIKFTKEVRPLDFTNSWGLILEFFLFVALVGSLWGRRPRLREVLASIGLLQLTLQMRRGLPVFLIAAAPWVAQSYRGIHAGWFARLNAALAPTHRTLAPALVSVGLCWITLAGWVSSPGRPNDVLDSRWSREHLPAGPAALLQKVGGEGRVFASFSDANLLEWALYPQRRVHIDGRTDLHARGDAFEASHRILLRYAGWHEELVGLDVEYVVLRRHLQLSRLLAERSEWSLIYADPTWLVFRKRQGS